MRLTAGNVWSEYRTIPWSSWPLPSYCGAMSQGVGRHLHCRPSCCWSCATVSNVHTVVDAITVALMQYCNPAGGSGLLLRLEPEDNYAATLMMFGGFQRGKREQLMGAVYAAALCSLQSQSGPLLSILHHTRPPHNPAAQCDCDRLTSSAALRIRLDQASVENNALSWTREEMPGPRNMNDAVLLPSGHVLIVNGAQVCCCLQVCTCCLCACLSKVMLTARWHAMTVMLTYDAHAIPSPSVASLETHGRLL